MQTRTYLCELGFDLYSHILSLTLFLAFIRAHSVVKYNVQFTTVHVECTHIYLSLCLHRAHDRYLSAPFYYCLAHFVQRNENGSVKAISKYNLARNK